MVWYFIYRNIDRVFSLKRSVSSLASYSLFLQTPTYKNPQYSELQNSKKKKMYSSDDYILPGPPSRSNLSAADLSSSGLLAFASGSSVSLVESHSLQLISTVSLPTPPSCAFSTVTSVRWAPVSVSFDLLIAVGDHLGRIALVDFRLCSVRLWLEQSCENVRGKNLGSGGGIQDLRWVLARPESYILAAISGPSFLSLYTDSGRLF